MASLAMLSVPVRAPTNAGVNAIEIVQLAPIARLAPQVLVLVKSPLVAMALILSIAVPVLGNETVCAMLVVPWTWLAKARLLGDKLTTGTLLTRQGDDDGTLKGSQMAKELKFEIVNPLGAPETSPTIANPFWKFT